MRAHRIAGIRPRRPERATTPSPSAPKPPDLLGRRFSPGAPDRARRSDITYIRTGEGWLYLAAVSDVGSRRPVGYAMGDRIDTRLVAAALDMAANARAGRTAGIIFHSDHGSQTSPASSATPPPAGVSPSPPAGSDPQRTTPPPKRSSPASSENPSTGAATPTAPAPAGRSSNGSPATTPTGATPASDSPHRHNTNSTTVTPREPTPP